MTTSTTNLPSGKIVINHERGPCPNCQVGLPEILREGQTLEVIYSPDGGKTLRQDTFQGGVKFDPKIHRQTGTPFF